MERGQKISCPVCFYLSGSYFVPAGEFKIFKCANCGLEHTNPQPSESQLREFYSTYSDIRASSDVVRKNAVRNINSLKSFGYDSSKTILDFGTGAGDFVDIAGDHCFGIDFNRVKKERCFASLSELPLTSFDFVTLWGVLEHLPDPLKTFSEVLNVLGPSGFVIITTVNAEGLIPYYYKPVEHLTYWTKPAISVLFEKLGLELIVYKPYEMIQRADVYIDRVLSRMPIDYRSSFSEVASALPKYINVPTNEVYVVGKRLKK